MRKDKVPYSSLQRAHIVIDFFVMTHEMNAFLLPDDQHIVSIVKKDNYEGLDGDIERA